MYENFLKGALFGKLGNDLHRPAQCSKGSRGVQLVVFVPIKFYQHTMFVALLRIELT